MAAFRRHFVALATIFICSVNTAQCSEIPTTVKKPRGEPGVWYQPLIPDEKFVDAGQEELFKRKKPKLSDLIYFVNSKEELKAPVSNATAVKAWTPEEKADMERIFDRILHVCPGLLIAASSGQPLALCRVEKLDQSMSKIVGTSFADNPSAAAASWAVLVSDSLFNYPDQFEQLTHELTHEADYGGRVSHSKKWVDFIDRDMRLSRLKMATTPSYDVKHIAKELRVKNIFPSEYSTTNLKESLAEITSAYICDTDFSVNPTYKEVFAPMLLLPSQRDMKADLAYKHGIEAVTAKDHAKALKCFRTALSIDPKLPLAAAELSNEYSRVGDYRNSLKASKHALKIFRANGVSYSDNEMRYVAYQKASAEGHLQHLDAAIQTITEILKEIPLDNFALYTRKYYETSTKDFKDAAIDLYKSVHAQEYATLFKDAAIDPTALSNSLNIEIQRYPGLNELVLRQAHYQEWLGDRADNEITKFEHYKEARDNFEKVYKTEKSPPPSLLLYCCNINLKLQDVEAAQRYMDESEKNNPKSFETRIMKIATLATKGKSDDAARLSDTLFTDYRAELTALLPDQLQLRAQSDKDSTPIKSASERRANFSADINANPNEPFRYLARARYFNGEKEFGNAISDLNNAIKLPEFKTLSPDQSIQYYQALGYAHENLKEQKAALEAYTEALTFDAHDPYALERRANLFADTKEPKKALADLDKLLKLTPNDVRALSLRAYLYSLLGKNSRATQAYTEAIKQQPLVAMHYANRATLYQRTNEPDKALVDLNQAIRLAPDDYFAYSTRGYVYSVKGEYDKAMEDYDMALKLKPDDKFSQKHKELLKTFMEKKKRKKTKTASGL